MTHSSIFSLNMLKISNIPLSIGDLYFETLNLMTLSILASMFLLLDSFKHPIIIKFTVLKISVDRKSFSLFSVYTFFLKQIYIRYTLSP